MNLKAFSPRVVISCVFLAGMGLSVRAADSNAITVKSPDGAIVVTLTPGDHLNYSVTFHDKTVLAPSSLGITIKGNDLGKNASFTGPSLDKEINEQYPTRGWHTTATNHCETSTIPVQGGDTGTAWQLEMRVFNDGVAYRYLVAGGGVQHIDGESSSWNIPAGSTLYYQDAKNRAYESKFRSDEIGKVAPNAQVSAPATIKFPDNIGYGVMTEANLVGYSDMDLTFKGDTTFQALFFDSPQGWDTRGDLVTPWRVTILVPDLNSLVNTDIIKNLCPPPSDDLVNASWIRPGRSIWHWLTGGGPKLPEQPTWIDGASALGYEYYLVDDGWRDWNGGGDRAWDALEGVVKYAKSKNVQIWAWVGAGYVKTPQDRQTYFQKAKDIGVVGLKIDFPDAPNTAWIKWYDDVLQDGAKYKLMIDFHGAVKPSGRDRTWPQEMSREAVAGREQGKNSPVHDTILPFSRYVQGHADYTPTLLQAKRLNGSSFAHELAMPIVFTSEFLCLGDNPKNYLDSVAVDVIKALPCLWDETVVLPCSTIGETAAFARRHGDDWFIGVINGPKHDTTIALTFLPAGSYKIVELADDPDKNDAFVRSEKTVTNQDTLKVPLRNDGGYVAWLTKTP